jgi:hypothetical protein
MVTARVDNLGTTSPLTRHLSMDVQLCSVAVNVLFRKGGDARQLY